MSAVIRPAEDQFAPMQAEDIDEIVTIENDLYPFPWTRGNFRDSLNAGYSAWTLRTVHGELIAYAVVMIALDEAHLLNLSVARAFQRRGHGWQTLERMAANARDHGARSMLLEVRPSNITGQRLYAGYGFERIGRRRDYYPAAGGREDAIVMRIAL
jgi:ribosomal-protein-alanine N-acetyltransferase